MYTISLNRDFLLQTYQEPGLPGTGLDIETLSANLKAFATLEEGVSFFTRKAEIFGYVCDHMRVLVSPDDLFVTLGIWGRKNLFEASVQPTWLRRVMDVDLAHVRELIDELRECGRNVITHRWDFWHAVPDWDAILSLGFAGLLKRAERAKVDFVEAHGDDVTDENRAFFDGVISAYKSIVRLLGRLRKVAVTEQCQPETIEALEQLQTGAPETFYQVFLTIWLFYQLSEYGDAIQTRSFGNLDRILYPYYCRDVEAGRLTEEGARTIIRNFLLKVSSMNYYYGHPFYFGGTNKDGSSAINELSYMLLDEYGKLGIFDPKLQIKVSGVTPVPFVNKALDLIRSGRNSIVFVGEPCMQRAMELAGYTADEARTVDIKGCYEYSSRGNAVETANIVLKLQNLLLEMVFEERDYADFDEFKRAFDAKLKTLCEQVILVNDESERFLERICPALLFSGASARALSLGVDGYARGSKYNISNVWLMAPATTANCLNVIRKFVFERKIVSLEALREILRTNWEGQEPLRQMILKDEEKYGNNRERGDDMMVWLCETIASYINGKPNSRGGFYTTALHSSNSFMWEGRRTGATPDGRRTGDELTKNASVQAGTNLNGVTAMIQSMLKMDSSHFMSDFPLDVMLHPATVRGEDGLEAMRALLMSYILRNGHAIHFNVFSTELLHKAQANPELYRDLQVRICGWNVLWNSLSKQEQDSYILQAEVNEQ